MDLLKRSCLMKFVIGSTLFSMMSGCTPSAGIKDSTVRDRVNACSAGFSDDVGAALQLAYNKIAIQGGTTADFKNESQAVIFSMLPEQDRLKAYEDYINCIEQNWNQSCLPQQKKYSSKAVKTLSNPAQPKSINKP